MADEQIEVNEPLKLEDVLSTIGDVVNTFRALIPIEGQRFLGNQVCQKEYKPLMWSAVTFGQTGSYAMIVGVYYIQDYVSNMF